MVEIICSNIPGIRNYKIHPYGHVPVIAKPQLVPKITITPQTQGAMSGTRQVKSKRQASFSSTLTSVKPKPAALESQKDVKDLKPVIDKISVPSVAAIIKSKLSSQTGSGSELKPNSPSPSSPVPDNSPAAADLLKPKPMPKSIAGTPEIKGPNSSLSPMPKLKPSLIVKISANTLSTKMSNSAEGQSQSQTKGKTYSVSHSSASVTGTDFDSLPPSPTLSTSSGSVLTPPSTPISVPTKASLKAMDTGERDSPAKKKKKKKSKNEPRKVIPLKERSFNPNEHCGVANADGSQCKRSLTCKTHSMALRRAVPCRSQPFDTLLASHKKARDEAKVAKQGEDFMTVYICISLSFILSKP